MVRWGVVLRCAMRHATADADAVSVILGLSGPDESVSSALRLVDEHTN